MATVINSATTDLRSLPPALAGFAYNAMDCIVTLDVARTICPKAETEAEVPYRFVRAMQAPALDMMRRGVLVQTKVRMDEIKGLEAERAKLEAKLELLACAVWGPGQTKGVKNPVQLPSLNPDSPKQMCAFFYDALKMPPHYAIRKTPQGNVRTLSCDHKALEALAKHPTKGPGVNPYDRNFEKVNLAAPIVKIILAMRTIGKLLSVARCRLSPANRLHCSYNVAGTVTGRWSSSADAFNLGSNLQNITERMRRMGCADAGMKMAAPDLEQAESRLVAALTWACTGDDTYWRACESGDLHTVVVTMSYPELFEGIGHWDTVEGGFIGDLKACRQIADGPWYRHLSYRDGGKRIGHGSNYWGTPFGIASAIGIPPPIVVGFQRRYFGAFPAIPQWHRHTIAEVQTKQRLTTPLGRTRIFFDRASEDSTLREAIAHVPQSTIGEMLNEGLRRVWAATMRDKLPVQLLLQVHDSIVFQYSETANEAEILKRVGDLLTVPIPITRTDGSETRILRIPLEFKTGWNWARQDPKRELFPDGNPDGLAKFSPDRADARKRQQPARPAAADFLG